MKWMMKILYLKLVILFQYQNIKTFFEKAMFQIGLKKFLWLKKLYAISDLKDQEIVGMFYEKGLQKTNQKTFRFEKAINYMWNGKATIRIIK